jgi:rubrerythrin
VFAEGAETLRQGVDDRQALLIGIKCERRSHKFFKRYGERFEDSEGKRIFLEFADEERVHLDLLIREYRALRDRQVLPSAHGKATRHAPKVRRAAPVRSSR